MSILDSLAQQAGKIANDVQGSLRKARDQSRKIVDKAAKKAAKKLGV